MVLVDYTSIHVRYRSLGKNGEREGGRTRNCTSVGSLLVRGISCIYEKFKKFREHAEIGTKYTGIIF